MSPMCLQVYDIWDLMSALLRATHGGATVYKIIPRAVPSPLNNGPYAGLFFCLLPRGRNGFLPQATADPIQVCSTLKPASQDQACPFCFWPLWGWILPSGLNG